MSFFQHLDTRTKSSWKSLMETQAMGLADPPKHLNPPFFCIGSCFAEEIKKAIMRRGQQALPEYNATVHFDVDSRVDQLPDRDHLNFYNPVSIKNELVRANFGFDALPWEPITVSGATIANSQLVASNNNTCFQDPYRRLIFSNDETKLREIATQVTEAVRQGVKTAKTAIVTIGLIEIFEDRHGLATNLYPGYGMSGIPQPEEYKKLIFNVLSHTQVTEAICEIHELITRLNPHIHIYWTISPVPLGRTYSNDDIFVANMTSKSRLRSAITECLDYLPNNNHYFPSYEIVTNIGRSAFDADGRHVLSAIVDQIIEGFLYLQAKS